MPICGPGKARIGTRGGPFLKKDVFAVFASTQTDERTYLFILDSTLQELILPARVWSARVYEGRELPLSVDAKRSRASLPEARRDDIRVLALTLDGHESGRP